jgi:single-stranded DNA-binding protein
MSNNTVELIGYPSKTPIHIESGENPFLAIGIATQESYKDQNDEWQQRKAIFHDVLVFKEDMIEQYKELTTKDRLKITGYLNYEFIKARTLDDKETTFKKASVIAKKIEAVPIIPKNEPEPVT